jgi:hypothetical protein
MKIEVIISWVIIGIIGLVLYTAPKTLLVYAKEKFESFVGRSGNITGTLTAEQIDLLRPMLYSVNFDEGSKGVVKQPEGVAGSTNSKSSHADVQNVSCLSSGQGVAYRKLVNPGEPSSANLKTQSDLVPTPIPDNSPKCPDLKDYIRKDKIPCWGCKL